MVKQSAAIAAVISVVAAGAVSVYAVTTIVRPMRSAVAELKERVEELEHRLEEMEAEREETQTGGAEERLMREPDADSDYVWPLAETDIELTSPYGIRKSPFVEGAEAYHTGVDMTGTWRAQVVAIADGVVTEHWPPPGTPHPGGGEYRGHEVYGGVVEIEHEDGTESLYAHLSSTRVHQGQRVQAGTVIGRMGDTGRADGEHLHFELTVDDRRVNPLRYLGALEDDDG